MFAGSSSTSTRWRVAVGSPTPVLPKLVSVPLSSLPRISPCPRASVYSARGMGTLALTNAPANAMAAVMSLLLATVPAATGKGHRPEIYRSPERESAA